MVLVTQPKRWLYQSVTGVIRWWLVGYGGTQAAPLRAPRRVESSCLSLQMPRPSSASQSAGGPWSLTSGKASLALLYFWLNAAPAGPSETTWPSAKMHQTPDTPSTTGCTAAENAAARSACRQAEHRTLHYPAPTIRPQRPPILGLILRPTTAPVRRNQLHVPGRAKGGISEVFVEPIVAALLRPLTDLLQQLLKHFLLHQQ